MRPAAWIHKAKVLLHRYRRWEPLVFFVLGFTFDLFLLHRIDDPLMLIHQALYLTLSAMLIAGDLFFEYGKLQVPKLLAKLWSYREGLLHFLLGTLLNVYTIFYFKSGTFITSLVFMIILAALLFLNEARPHRVPKHVLRNALFSLCLLSYFGILVPIFFGSIGDLVFLGSIASATGVFTFYYWFMQTRIEKSLLERSVRLPFFAVTLVFSLLYFFKVLPPVPLSLKHIGIYHEVSKSDDQYKLGYSRSRWLFWQSGDQNFEAYPGDKVYCFVQVFSPTRFKDQLFVRWQFKDPKMGWDDFDKVPFSISGGRDEGYRGFTVKSNYQPGTWRVAIETSDGREIGRIGLEIIPKQGPLEDRTLNYEYR